MNKRIKAEVIPNKWQNFFDITLEISAINGPPLTSSAAIFIHDSYNLPDNVIYVTPNDKGLIQQTLIGYEAFTVGALLPDGTELELDLNDQLGYPKGFYWGKDK